MYTTITEKFIIALVVLMLVLLIVVPIAMVLYLPTEGQIVKKEFFEAHQESRFEYNLLTEAMECNTYKIPPKWQITIEDEERRHRDIEVKPTEYESLKIGQWYKLK